MSLTTTEFGLLAQGMGVFVLVCALITGIAFARSWSWRFRFVGVTSFSVVLTAGLFALSITPFIVPTVTGAVPYDIVFDRFGPEAVITVSPKITTEQLDATLRQASNRLFSTGRNSQNTTDQLTIRARTVLHLRPGVSQPLYIGEVKRSLRRRDDPKMEVQIFQDELAKISAE